MRPSLLRKRVVIAVCACAAMALAIGVGLQRPAAALVPAVQKYLAAKHIGIAAGQTGRVTVKNLFGDGSVRLAVAIIDGTSNTTLGGTKDPVMLEPGEVFVHDLSARELNLEPPERREVIWVIRMLVPASGPLPLTSVQLYNNADGVTLQMLPYIEQDNLFQKVREAANR